MRAKRIDRDLSKCHMSDTAEGNVNEEPTSRDVKENHEGADSHKSIKTTLIDNIYLMGIELSTKQDQKR